jgi:outer membrane lipoprotein-sorting protein
VRARRLGLVAALVVAGPALAARAEAAPAQAGAAPAQAARAPAAPPPSVDELLARLDASSKDLVTLKGEFTQRNRVKLFKQELRSTGRLVYRRPRQIRWEYLAPDPSALVLDGERATLTMPGAAPQVFDLEHDATLRPIFDQLLFWLSPGSIGHEREQYDLVVGGTAELPTLALTPKGGPMARAFRRIELRLDGKSGLLRGILLVEKNGDEKEIVFTRLERNVPLPADAFR